MNDVKKQIWRPSLTCLSAVLMTLLPLVLPVGAHAQDCRDGADGCVAVGEWAFSIAVGVGGRTNPVIKSDDIPIILIPTISYYGKRFFWETDTFGFTFLESKHHMVNAIATISYDQVFFNEWGVGNFSIEGASGSNVGRIESSLEMRAGEGVVDQLVGGPVLSSPPLPPGEPTRPDPVRDMLGPVIDDGGGAIDLNRLHDRNITGLAGLEYSFSTSAYSVAFQALSEVGGEHHGSQVRAAISRFIELRRSGMELVLGVEWRDSKTTQYYYGVDEDEVDDARHAYLLGSDVSYYARLGWRYQLSAAWQLRGVVHHRMLGDDITSSPLVSEDSTTAVFFGGSYHF